ncbi:fidgetin isoform X1 [Triplophysa dalaica]|uniref:fidgetin isoform X1 n=1 Tax=Triplophysa dalaica TaxID=1582913 RepID=UPI0024DF9B57|nr:fidgetin isoform X1 [Triplophysa dalaica]
MGFWREIRRERAVLGVGVTMQWSPEQSQWAEQHYDITSTTRSPGRKIEVLRDPRLTGSSSAAYHHSWANDDISALTASNLLKRYAERYSILDLPCENGLMGYPDAAVSVNVNGPGVANNGPPLLNGRKMEAEPWLETVYTPLGCVSELLPKAPLSVSDVSVCNSPIVGNGSLSEPFSSSSCTSQSGNQEYSSALFSTPYLQPLGTYGGSLFHPTPSHASLVPAYSANTSPSLAVYSYPNTRYPSQAILPTGFSPPPHPSGYLPRGITPPNPLPAVGFSYPTTNLGTNTSESDAPSATSHTKTYYPSTQREIGVFEEFSFPENGNSDSRSGSSPLYRLSGDDSVDKRTGFSQSADVTSSLSFKPTNHGDSLRSLESLTVAMIGQNNGTSTSAVPSHQHLCLDTNTPC